MAALSASFTEVLLSLENGYLVDIVQHVRPVNGLRYSQSLVSGDVEGRFSQLFSRVSAVNSKNGPFEMLLCVGNYFGTSKEDFEPYLNGSRKVPIQTFILGPNTLESAEFYPSEDGAELCPNLTYLGKQGVFTANSGLKMVYLSGVDTSETNSKQCSHGFTASQVDGLVTPLVDKNAFKGVDVLLTSHWPRNVTKYGASLEHDIDPSVTGSLIVSRLASAVRPRYHFSALEGVHYERLPYRNHRVLAEPARHATRFIALAKVANPAKKKWLYAFTVVPLETMEHSELVKQPPDVTECPFQFEESLNDPNAGEPQNRLQYFYDMSQPGGCGGGHKRGQGNGETGNRRQHQNKRPRTLPPLASCWFCLSSSHVEKHLVVSVGDHNYLALPKGGLTPDHVLILPIGHCQATVGLEEDAMFKTALTKFFSSQQKTVVFFERNYKSHHLQIQVVPVPLDKAGNIKQAFLNVAEVQNLTLDVIPGHSNLSQIMNRGAPYFYAEIAATGEKLLHRVRRHFPLQFGREVLAASTLLSVPDKVDWRECVADKEAETELANQFRKSFEPFDFTV